MEMVNGTSAAVQLAKEILGRSQYWLGRIAEQDAARDDFATEELINAVNRSDYPDDLRFLEALSEKALSELQQPAQEESK